MGHTPLTFPHLQPCRTTLRSSRSTRTTCSCALSSLLGSSTQGSSLRMWRSLTRSPTCGARPTLSSSSLFSSSTTGPSRSALLLLLPSSRSGGSASRGTSSTASSKWATTSGLTAPVRLSPFSSFGPSRSHGSGSSLSPPSSLPGSKPRLPTTQQGKHLGHLVRGGRLGGRSFWRLSRVHRRPPEERIQKQPRQQRQVLRCGRLVSLSPPKLPG